MSNSSNLVLPYLAVGQAQKHVTVNETIRKLDAIVQLAVVSATTTLQPAAPDDGAVYIVPSGKSGDAWSAFGNWSLGYYRDGAWVEVSPREGWLAYVKDTDEIVSFTGSGWEGLAAALRLSATDRLLGRASSGAGMAEEIVCTAAGRALLDDDDANAQCATLGTWRVLAAQAVAASHTGDTTETALATITLPGAAMGPNGALRITAVFSHTNSAGAKTLRCRLGGSGVSGSQLMGVSVTTTASIMTQRLVQNRNSESSQVAGPSGIASSFGASNNAPASAAVDTSVDQIIVISGQLASGSDTVTLESCLIEVLHGA